MSSVKGGRAVRDYGEVARGEVLSLAVVDSG